MPQTLKISLLLKIESGPLAVARARTAAKMVTKHPFKYSLLHQWHYISPSQNINLSEIAKVGGGRETEIKQTEESKP